MLKRWGTEIRKWFFAERISKDSQPMPNDEVSAVRRGFFKTAAVGAVSITGTAGLAKVVVDSVPEPDMQDKYIPGRPGWRAGTQESRVCADVRPGEVGYGAVIHRPLLRPGMMRFLVLIRHPSRTSWRQCNVGVSRFSPTPVSIICSPPHFT